MKNLKKTVCKALCGAALVLLMAGCADILNGPSAPEAKPGRITLTVGAGPARTAAPALDQFKKIILAIESQDGETALADVDVNVSSGSAEVELPLGVWNITAKAYLDTEGKNLAAVSLPHEFSYNGSGNPTGDTRFVLAAIGDGPGTLQYTIKVPDVTLAVSGSRIQIEADGAVFEELADDNFTAGVHDIEGNEENVAVTLPAGRYVADILLIKDNNDTAVFQETILIMPGLITMLRYEPAAAAFLDPEARALITDIDSLEFNPTTADAVGILIDENLTPTIDPFVYELGITAPSETNPVYFTMKKEAAHSVGVGGKDKDLISAFENGHGAEGDEAGPDLAVFAANTASVLEEGGELRFTLAVGKEGKTPVEIAVTLTVEAPAIKLLWIDSSVSEDSESLAPVPDQDAITGLQQALTWLETNAASNTKYVVKVSGEDNQITSVFSSRTGVSGVRITLRGIGEERIVYTTLTNVVSELFSVNGGTTLVLDENITLDGRGEALYTDNTPKYFFQVKGGALEMKAGSKITRYKSWSVAIASYPIYITNGGAFRMDGGTIDQTMGGSGVVNVSNGSFEMRDGAKITDNTLSYTDPTDTLANHTAIHLQASGSAVIVGTNGAFTMHGGEISNTNHRGVYVNTNGQFTMKGGVIKNNGNAGLKYSSSDVYTYPIGAGVYISTWQKPFIMEGGEISGNGNSSSPASGIYNTCTLNGEVTIKDNAIASSYIYIGNKFSSTTSAIAYDVCYMYSPATQEDVASAYTGFKVLTALEEENPMVIDATLAEKFTPLKFYKAYQTVQDTEYFPGLDGKYFFNDSGEITAYEN
jgi:hypothetical protein